MKPVRWSVRVGVLALSLALGIAAQAAPTRITFLHLNDIDEAAPRIGNNGVASLMTLLRRARGADTPTVTTFGGDLLAPSMTSSLTKGAHMVALMNALGVDIAVLGNHEFDFGPEVTAERVEESRFPWLGTNVLARAGRPAVGAHTTMIVERGGVRIGFFGLLTPETTRLSSPGTGIRFLPVVETAKAAVQRLSEDGAEVVVALTHLPTAEDRRLAREVPGLHLILGGHDHAPHSEFVNGVLILKSGWNARWLGAVDLIIERGGSDGGGLALHVGWRMLPTAGVAPDTEVAALVARHEAALDAALAEPIGKTAVALDSRRAAVRGRETAIGNLVADALRAATGADAALINGGNIRGDRLYEAGATLTRKDVLAELPFDNVAVVLAVSGATLRAALETGVSGPVEGDGRFPQVSGIEMVWDKAAPPGARIVSVTVGGEPLDPDATYRLATTDFLARGGDGYEGLAEVERIGGGARGGGTPLATIVMDSIAAHGTVAPVVEGRIRTK